MAKYWIAGATKNKGAFTRKAKAAGESVKSYAKEKYHAKGTTGKQARLATTLASFAKKRYAKKVKK